VHEPEPTSRSAAPWFQERPRLTVAVALVLFAAVIGLLFAVDPAQDQISLFFCLPIALLAVAFGLRAGLLAGLGGILLVAVWVLADDRSVSVLGWAAQAVPMLLLGVLLGDAVDRLRGSEGQRRRLEGVAQRHRDAVEFNDSVVQRLAAAKWAMEAGRTERGLEIIAETLDAAQALVSDWIRDAEMGVPRKR
jgi:glucose-6-phosphate-specific signal transduction histidine kinase